MVNPMKLGNLILAGIFLICTTCTDDVCEVTGPTTDIPTFSFGYYDIFGASRDTGLEYVGGTISISSTSVAVEYEDDSGRVWKVRYRVGSIIEGD
jgi:hypothetical protein